MRISKFSVAAGRGAGGMGKRIVEVMSPALVAHDVNR